MPPFLTNSKEPQIPSIDYTLFCRFCQYSKAMLTHSFRNKKDFKTLFVVS